MTFHHTTLTLAAAALLALTTAPAMASDAHCFPQAQYEALDPEDRYANGAMTDETEVAAMEELIETQWKMRLTGVPLANVSGDAGQVAGVDLLAQTEAAVILNEERLRENRRTGSKYLYVSPEMKRLARQRAQIRGLKRKPCNPHILYLGSY